MYVEIIFSGVTLITLAYLYMKRRKSKPSCGSLMKVPVVTGKLPYAGNGFGFQNDIIGYIQNCHKKYGPIFELKIFRKRIVVVCDHKFKDEFFTATEEEMSLYDVLNNLYFGEAFADDADSLPRIIEIIKKTIKVNFEDFAVKIMDEAQSLVSDLREESLHTNKPIKITEAMIKFVSRTSARCFMGIDITEEFYAALMNFTNLLNKIVVFTYFFPKWALRWWFAKKLRVYRMQMIEMMEDEIKKYREDPRKKDSMVFRKSVDYRTKDGKSLNNREIGEIITCLLYVSSENTALGLAATITDLSLHQDVWDLVKQESTKHLQEQDIKSLFGSPVLQACIMESARLNSHVFALQRLPKMKAVIGGYDVSGVDSVALCEPMLMIYNQGDYKDPQTYNPLRFIEGDEPKNPRNILAWGAGKHLCPGKQFAIYEIKAAAALFTTNFERFEIPPKEFGALNYFSPSAFAERQVKMKLTPLHEDELVVPHPVTKIKDGKKQYRVVSYLCDGETKGWLIRDFLDKKEQQMMYAYTVKLADRSEIEAEINKAKTDKAFPLTFDNLIYTGSSNCVSEPVIWYEWASKVWDLLLDNKDVIAFSESEPKRFDSLYSQLYGLDATMSIHKDEYVNWGISASFGCSCVFTFGDHEIILNTGDVFIADFSQVDHGVKQIIDNAPGWWSEEESKFYKFTFGRSRCSVQIRDLSNVNNNETMSISKFKDMVQSS